MSNYIVTFTLNHGRYTQMIGAASVAEARRLIASRFPGCSITNIRKA